MRKKLITACAALASTMLLLTGCGVSNASGKTVIRFATWDKAEDADFQQKIVDEYNSSHDKVQVQFEAYGENFDTKISAGMGSGDAPDVMYMWNYPNYAGGLQELDSYIKKEKSDFKKEFYPTLWSYNSYQGKIYGIPVGFTTQGLYYNKDIFKQAGVKFPDASWTWDDLQQAAKTITAKTGKKGFEFQMKPDPYDFEMYLWSNGTAYSNKQGQPNGYVNSPEAIETYTMFQKMEKDGYAMASEDNGSDAFRAGTVAMYIYGAWGIDQLVQDKLNFGISTLPAFSNSKKSVSILSSSGVAMDKASKHKNAAWDFIKYWTNAECNKKRIGRELPVRPSVVKAEKVMDKALYKPFYTMLNQSNGYSPSSFRMKKWNQFSDKLQLAYQKMFNPSSYENPASAIAPTLK